MQIAKLVTVWLVLLTPLKLHAANYFVAPDGSDTAAGTEAAPFATVGRAQTAAKAGDTVYIRGGTFAFSGSGTVGVAFSKSGTAGSPINYFAYTDEIPVFDLTDRMPSGRVTGLDVHCSYIHIRGLEVKGVHQFQSGQDSWGVRIQGSNNILENLNVHNNDAPGIFITSGANNLILNCDSHHNYDRLESGGSGDGFGCHSSGGGNVIRGCRAYDNSDDGYDFISASGTCTVEKSWAFRNGYIPDTTDTAGNGAGFKAGGYGLNASDFPANVPRHTVRQCVAFGNRSQGFYANHHPGGIDFFNNTAFRNGVNYNMLADVGASSHKLRNNIAMAPGTAISNLTGGTDTFNSWTLSVTISSDDFLSVVESEASAARQADGSLPNGKLMRLVAGSDLIDKGEDVDLPFVGAAPDLGAFEFGASSGTAGTGGATGAGGGTGKGGAGEPSGTGGTKTTATGGTTGTGGVTKTGTTAGSGGTGGRSVTDGGVGTAGTGLVATNGGSMTAGASGSADDSAGGCGCRIHGGEEHGRMPVGATLFGLLLLLARIRRSKDGK